MKNRECLRDIKVKYLQKMIGDYYFMRNDALILEAADFGRYLRQEERAESTVKKYLRDLQAFLLWLDGRPLNKEATAAWKEQLLRQSYAPATINSMLAALNTFLRFTGRDACRVKFLKLQRMETISATGIRVGEVKYITLEALRRGRAEIALKGKIRTILLPAKLCRKLQKYARKQKIASGEIFRTGSGKSLHRRQIWAEMKALCQHAGVARSKVFPHNLRHLFATAFYRACKDVVRLADVLGHSSIETTRIYLLTTGKEHRRALERLGFVT